MPVDPTDVPNAGPASTDEARQIGHLVKEVAEAEGFRSFELNFGEDSTGSPAVWIYFILDPAYPTTPREIKLLTRLGRAVKSRLFQNQINRVPYVRFREKSVAAG